MEIAEKRPKMTQQIHGENAPDRANRLVRDLCSVTEQRHNSDLPVPVTPMVRKVTRLKADPVKLQGLLEMPFHYFIKHQTSHYL
jgi:hypothetical protein